MPRARTSDPRLRGATVTATSLWLVCALPAIALASVTAGPDLHGQYHPKQSRWQRTLFEQVSQRAAALSRAAEPALLERLGSAEFRAQLATCCPEASRLSARQLLGRLQEQVRASEVVSAFSAEQDPQATQQGTYHMTIADGVANSFLLSQWEATFLHGAHFNMSGMTIYQATCESGGRRATLKTFGSQSCTGTPAKSITEPLNKCFRDAGNPGLLFKLGCAGGVLTQDVWSPHLSGVRFKDREGHPLGTGPFLDEQCPPTPPVTSISWTANGECHMKQTSENYWEFVDFAEVAIYGLKPFARAHDPQTFEEVAERAVYCLVNDGLIDMGSPAFGQVSTVLSARFARSSVLLAAMDTGTWEGSCNQTRPNSTSQNCSAPVRQLGTLQHFNHLFLINDGFWGKLGTLAYRLKRLEGAWGSRPSSAGDLLSYFEAVPVAPILFPGGVRFLIGDFPNLFGSELGALLQRWARQRGWVLVWSLGLNVGARVDIETFFEQSRGMTWEANNRLLDPTVVSNTSARSSLSLPKPRRAELSFQGYWAEAAALRLLPTTTNVTWAGLWGRLAGAMPPDLQLSPLRGGDCPRPETAPECVGKSGTGTCVCYADSPGSVSGLEQEPEPPSVFV